MSEESFILMVSIFAGRCFKFTDLHCSTMALQMYLLPSCGTSTLWQEFWWEIFMHTHSNWNRTIIFQMSNPEHQRAKWQDCNWFIEVKQSKCTIYNRHQIFVHLSIFLPACICFCQPHPPAIVWDWTLIWLPALVWRSTYFCHKHNFLECCRLSLCMCPVPYDSVVESIGFNWLSWRKKNGSTTGIQPMDEY